MSSLTLWSRPFATRPYLRTYGRPATRTVVRTVSRPSAGFVPAAEVARDGADALVKLELPGLDVAKDVVVEVIGGRLVVRGERRDERSEEHGGRSLREVRYGSFRRSFALPAGVDADAVTATYDAGVLTVRVAGAYSGTDARRITVTAAPAELKSPERPAAEQAGE